MKKQDFTLQKIATIPNFLSLFRLFLAYAFWQQYIHASTPSEYLFAGSLLVVSGVTDVLDGQIARRFNMVSEVGKILDPIADKVTQAMIMLCLVEKYPLIIFELGLFVVKQIYMSLAGLYILKISGENVGARWYGKINTVILYGCFILMILPLRISIEIGNLLIVLSCLSIIATFIFYMRAYQEIIRDVSIT